MPAAGPVVPPAALPCAELRMGPAEAAEAKGAIMWNSFHTDERLAITAEITTFPGGYGHEAHAYVARPRGRVRFPGSW